MCPSTGDDVLSAYTSPLLVDLLDSAIKQVRMFPELSCTFKVSDRKLDLLLPDLLPGRLEPLPRDRAAH